MERYNLRSGSLATTVVSSSSEIQDSGRTEESHLTHFAVRDAARLAAECIALNLMESGEILSPSKTPGIETFQAKEIREPVESSGVWGEVVVRVFLIPTLTETLPVLSPGTVSTVLGESWNTGKKYDQPPILHPFSSCPPLAAAYAIQGSSASSSMQSQATQQSALSLQTSQPSPLDTSFTSPLSPNVVKVSSLSLQTCQSAPQPPTTSQISSYVTHYSVNISSRKTIPGTISRPRLSINSSNMHIARQ